MAIILIYLLITFSRLERKTVKRKRVFATLKVLGTVLQQLTEEIPDELRRVMETDAAMMDDLIAYNIIPLDAPSPTNRIGFFPEVQAAISVLKYRGLPKLPEDFPILLQEKLMFLIFCTTFLDFRFVRLDQVVYWIWI
ncbi:callose synthase 9-like [Humulus lupulus]|uniref:callose synthase 9-like n=1 Tax=Humulus lupulus TaxID=3486 RepID=UPI002B40C0C2|nr:callose synthase 9-like [Humulus lupulus]